MIRHRRCFCFVLLALLSLGAVSRASAELQFPLEAKRILFLGDSITHSGQYVAWIETQLRLQGIHPLPEIVNIGLGSETCSGLSEPDHPFPRPDVHERLERALAKVKPDVVVACYGMNDGIYYPFGEERFKAYQNGVNRLVEKAHAAGAKVVLMTPPPFDPVPLRDKGKLKPASEEKYAYFAMYENYDDVLARYGKWVMTQKDRAEMLIDLHTPMTQYVAEKRKKDSQFTLSPDGIHPNAEGHRLLGETILRAWGIESTSEPDAELLKLMQQRMTLLHDAWLSDVGHKRPGIKPGLPLDEATAKAKELDALIQPLVAKAQQPTASHRPSTGGTIHQVQFPAMAKPGELRLSVDYYLWIPAETKRLRGVIVHQHGCGVGASLGGQTAADDLHWQALARRWDCALVGSCYEPREGVNCRSWCDPRNGSGERFLQALSHFASSTGHAELETVPWCLWGHSGGGFWASLMQVQHPERIVAIWLRSGTAFGYWTSGEIAAPEIPGAAYQVPVMGNPGLKEKDDARFHRAWDGLTAMQQAYREKGAFFEFAPDPRTGHECGDSRYLSIPFFDFWLEHRLPQPTASDQSLREVGDSQAAWEKTMAAKLAEYVQTGAVTDNTPPPAPLKVTATRNDNGSVTVTWQAEADFESGIRSFIIERGDQRIGQLPEKPAGRFGRPLFQMMSYHDTPERPLLQMTFTDTNAPVGDLPTYRVRTVNSVELESEPTASR
jgi:lysophospholipase L1-like esterase/pimeloyl-ACP methyl ester carboxylesterase